MAIDTVSTIRPDAFRAPRCVVDPPGFHQNVEALAAEFRECLLQAQGNGDG